MKVELASNTKTSLPRQVKRRVNSIAKGDLPWLRKREPTAPDIDLINRHRAGLADAWLAIDKNVNPSERRHRQARLQDWGDRADILRLEAERIQKEIEASRQRSLETVYGMTILKEFNQDAQTTLPWLRTKEPGVKDKDLLARHVRGLLDAYDVALIDDKTDPEERKKRESRLNDWGDRAVVFQDHLRNIDLDKKREEITEKAKQWNENDISRVMHDAYIFVRHLPKNQRQDLYERANITPETLTQTLKRWGVTVGSNAVTTFVPLESAIIGGTLAGASPLDKLGTVPLLASIAITYGFWFRGLGRAAKANNDLLEEKGTGTKIQAKVLYDLVSKYTESRRLRRLAGAFGYVAPQLYAEPAWIAAAIASVAAGIPLNEMLSAFTGINIGGAVGEELNARGTKKLNDNMS